MKASHKKHILRLIAELKNESSLAFDCGLECASINRISRNVADEMQLDLGLIERTRSGGWLSNDEEPGQFDICYSLTDKGIKLAESLIEGLK